MIDYKFYYSGPLLFHTTVKEEDLKKVRAICKKEISHRERLAGLIQEEFTINEVKFAEIMQKYLVFFNEAQKNWYQNADIILKPQAAWVNFMKKGECNPVHTHLNCDFSCVLFLEFPKGLKKERGKTISTGSKPGDLVFTFGAASPFYICERVVSPNVGDFFIFPWSLKHSVNSFQSKGVRTSVSCNFYIKNDR